jgi:lipopolysaccharide transport system ATP-binding protein
VAAFLEPEVLIVDEALSVGDAAFQEKCRQRMDALIKDGRTLLMVSHSSEMVSKVCRRCILLKGGRIAFDGSSEAGLEIYRIAA